MTVLRIGFDAVRALCNTTGLGNYARRVLRGMLGTPDAGIAGTLYSPAAPLPQFRRLPSEVGASLELPRGAWRSRGARSLWRTFRLGRRAAADGIELYHGLSHEIPRDLPRTGLSSVVSFLDLLWHRFPGLYPAVDRRSYEWRYRWSAEHAGALVAVSRQTRDDLVALYGVSPERVTVVHPPSDPRFGEPVPAEERQRVLARYRLPARFLLSVGTLEARKNQRTAIAALAGLDPARTPALLLVGRDRGQGVELVGFAERLGLAERVLVRTNVSDDELPAVMQSAALFLYPSLAEGFGLPIVEALCAGIPVVASAGGCFQEAGGRGSLYAPPTDAQAFAELIRRVLDDPALAARMSSEGRSHAARFDGKLLAARMRAVYDAVRSGAALPGDAGEHGTTKERS